MNLRVMILVDAGHHMLLVPIAVFSRYSCAPIEYLRRMAVCRALVSGKPHSLAMLAIDDDVFNRFLHASSNLRSVRNSLNVMLVALRNSRQKCSLL